MRELASARDDADPGRDGPVPVAPVACTQRPHMSGHALSYDTDASTPKYREGSNPEEWSRPATTPTAGSAGPGTEPNRREAPARGGAE